MADETEYIRWKTMVIDLPSNFISHTKNGVIKIKHPLTKTGNVSKASKEPAIVLRENPNIIEPKIIEKGLKQTMKQKKAEMQPIKEEYEKNKRNTLRKNILSKSREKNNDVYKDMIHTIYKPITTHKLRHLLKGLDEEEINEDRKQTNDALRKQILQKMRNVAKDKDTIDVILNDITKHKTSTKKLQNILKKLENQ